MDGQHDDASVEERLAALERENAELRRRLATEQPPAPATPPPSPRSAAGGRSGHRARAVACVVLITIGALLAPVGAVAAWAQRELTDTERYVETVGPLASDPVVQSAVAGRLTQAVMSRIDVGALLDDVVGGLEDNDIAPRATRALSALEAPLTSGVESFVRSAADRLVQSDAFEEAWVQANRVAHQQLVAVMRGDDGTVLQVGQDGQLTIELSGMIDLLKQRLVDRGLDVAANIPEVNASFTIVQTSQLVHVQNRYGQLVLLTTWLPWVALGLLAAGVLVANHRSRALVVAGLSLAAAMVLLAVALALARGLYLDALTGQVARLDAAEIVFDQVVAFLRNTLRTVGVLGLVLALVAYLAGPTDSARSLRSGFSGATDKGRTWAEGRGVTSGPFGTWLGGHKTFVRVVVVALAAMVLLLAGQPTPGLVVGTALVAGVVLALVELLGRPPRPEAAGEPVSG
ncbi:hypothetical protein IF650_05685 [Cellulosimicrobium terreum]|nr:hypothetical protein [Cellulosimicrobium terreum]